MEKQIQKGLLYVMWLWLPIAAILMLIKEIGEDRKKL